MGTSGSVVRKEELDHEQEQSATCQLTKKKLKSDFLIYYDSGSSKVHVYKVNRKETRTHKLGFTLPLAAGCCYSGYGLFIGGGYTVR